MTYLQLLPNAEFVYFGLDGCVFHLWNQKRFPCDRKSVALLNELLRGKPYEEAEYENEFNEYLLELMQEGMLYPMGNFLFGGYCIEPNRSNKTFIAASSFGYYNIRRKCVSELGVYKECIGLDFIRGSGGRASYYT